MSCSRPLKGWILGTNDNGKDDILVTSYTVDRLYGNWINGHFKPSQGYSDNYLTDAIDIPCGQCFECRLDRSRQWASRCMMEAQYHQSNYFLTLTYNDEHLPVNQYVDGDGVIGYSSTLVKRDLQLFMKRLRKRLDYPIRFFACGEYGSKGRPHYHLIVFGLKLDDLKFLKKSSAGFDYFTSELVEDCWKDERHNSIGFSMVCNVSWDTCAYVARYILKKQTGSDSQVYEIFNYEPEFITMSRRPGIAFQYYEDNHDKIYEHDKIYLGGDKSVITKPPKYFDSLFDIDYPDQFERLHAQRLKKSDNAKQRLLDALEVDYLTFLKNREDHHKKVVSMSLKREVE